jgi:hypothetical protein
MTCAFTDGDVFKVSLFTCFILQIIEIKLHANLCQGGGEHEFKTNDSKTSFWMGALQ